MSETKSFEEAMTELEKLASDMEQRDLTLDDAVLKFERGIQLSQFCRGRLSEAEAKIQKITKDNQLEDFLKPED